MRKQDGTMKNTYEFLTDLHKEWGNLNDEQKTAIALQFGGKNQMEVFMATMNNFETAIKATETAMGAQGSASRENAKAIDSLQGHLQNLKRAWEELSYKMISSDALKKGMDILTGALEFLSSDAGQVVVWGTAIATGFNLIAKAALGLKGLSIVKLFGKLGGALGGAAKGADKATDALKIMQGAQVGAAGGAGKLLSAFARVGGGLLAPAGLVAAIGLASVALAKYVDIGNKAKDVKITTDFEKAKSDVKETEKKYEALNDEMDKLRQKAKDGTITDSEKNRLTILENQTKQYERQLELKKEIAGDKADDYYHTVDPSKLKGKKKEEYATAMSTPGRTDDQALAMIGINDKIALSLNNVRAEADAVTTAQQKVTEAYEKHGKESQQYKDALEGLNKAQKEQGDTLEKLEKDRKKAIEDYGSEEAASKSLGNSWKDLNKEIKALKTLKGLNFKEPAKNMKALKKNADSLGLQFDKTGNKIKSVDLTKFTQKMTEAGFSVEDTWDYLKKLGEENPKLKIDVDGSKVAIKDLEFVDGKIQKIDGEEANIKITAHDVASAVMDAIEKRTSLGKAIKVLRVVGHPIVQNIIDKLTKKKSLGNAIKKIVQSGGDSVQRKLGTIAGTTSLGVAYKTISFVVSGLSGALRRFLGLKKGIRHFASGGSFLDNAEVNEQGFEIIQDADTGLMRVVNGGKRGTTHLNEGDSVFTHGQSVRMLRNAGLTEGKAVYGHGNEDFGLFGVKKLKGFKKGKNQKAYNKKYNAIKSAMESGVAKLEYLRSYYNWTDAGFNARYKKLYDRQNAALKRLNNSKTGKAKGVKRKTTLGRDIVRAYNLAIREEESAKAKKKIEDVITNTQGTYSDLKKMLSTINAANKAHTISADDAKEQKMEAYKKYIDYNLKQYENDKKTYAKSLTLIKDYYAKGRLSGEDYYKYLDDLAKSQLDKEKARLQEQQELNDNTYSLAKAYVQRQIDLLETENEEQEKQNELVELQNNLAKARNQRVRVYKEGEGFVYEKDTEAIREATQALQEYQSSATSSEEATNPVLAQWQEVLKLFDELEADYQLKALENKVGSTVGQLFGSLGTNTDAWSNWIKQNLSTTQGIGDVLTNLDKLVDTNDIINYLDSNGQVSQAIIDAAIKNNTLPATYAAAITQMAQGMSAGVNTAASLATQSSITAATSGAVVMGNATQYGNIYNFDNLVLPNVTNANEFIDGLNNLSTTALQTSTQRG